MFNRLICFRLLCILVISLINLQLRSQTRHFIPLIIESEETGERLVNVKVSSIFAGDIAYSDLYGFVSVKVRSEGDSIKISYFGYESQVISSTNISVSGGSKVIQLAPVTLPEVSIQADRIILETGGDKISMNATEIREIPALLGEVDPLKAISILPGISNSREGGAGVLVRGGTVSENIILLDEAQLYNTNHFFGLLSTFNPDVVESVDIYKGNYSPEYSDGLSSLIHVRSKEGNYKKHNQTLSLGIINSRLKLEGPVIKDKISYVFAARSSYLTLFTLPDIVSFRNRTGEFFFNYTMYDLNAKINMKLKNGGGIFYSFYRGRDFFGTGEQRIEPATFDSREINFDYGNTVHSVRWIQPLPRKNIILKSYLSYTGYSSSISNFSQTETNSDTTSNRFIQNNILRRIHLRSKLQFLPTNALEINMGLDVNWFGFNPLNLENISSEAGTLRQSFQIGRFSNALFTSIILRLPLGITSDFGLRYTLLRQGSFSSDYIEPRFSLSKTIGSKHLLKLSFARLTQTIHGVLNRNSISGLDNWMPATEFLPPSTSLNYSLSYHLVNNKTHEWSTSFFIRSWGQLIDVRPDIAFFTVGGQGWENNFITGGEGFARGIEVLYKLNVRKSKIQLAYTYMRNERRFAEFNQGEWYPANFERRHDLSVVYSQKINKIWTINALFTLASGAPFTAPSGARFNERGDVELIFSELNNARLPIYHRLDIAATRILPLKKGRTTELTFGVYNIYNRLNETSYYFINKFITDEASQQTRTGLTGRGLSLLPFIPHISWTYNF